MFGAIVTLTMAGIAKLQLAPAHALSNETSKAKKAYQDFFTLWKDADPDIPPEASLSRARRFGPAS
jgi:hypothetical protein